MRPKLVKIQSPGTCNPNLVIEFHCQSGILRSDPLHRLNCEENPTCGPAMADNESHVVAGGASHGVGSGEEAEGGGKWTGGIRNVLMDAPVEAVWELCSDWAHWQRWWPHGNPVSELREGENRKPGCLRFVESEPGVWIYERLLQCDNDNFFMSYCMEENVFCGGISGYFAKVKFGRQSDGKTMVEYWTYEVDPLKAMTRDAYTSFMEVFFTATLVKGIERGAQRLAAGLDPKPVC